MNSHQAAAQRRQMWKQRVRAGEVLICRDGAPIKGERDENTGKTVYHQSARPYFKMPNGNTMFLCPHCETQIPTVRRKWNQESQQWEVVDAR